MRVIKFRARRSDTKKSIPDFMEQYTVDTLNNTLNSEYFIIEQFTGLYDKNGKEIYEGDILATENHDPEYDLWKQSDHGYTVVQYKDFGFTFSNWQLELDRNNESVYSVEFVEVVGNIFENPEKLFKF